MPSAFWQVASRFFLTIENENLEIAFDIGQKRIADSGWLIATTDLNCYTQYHKYFVALYKVEKDL